MRPPSIGVSSIQASLPHYQSYFVYPCVVCLLGVATAYRTCQEGTNQSPIALGLNQGLAQNHRPSFEGYTGNVTGNFYNWGYGPAYTLDHAKDEYTTLPSMTFDDETLYLRGWHLHAPADHSVGGDRSKSELHMVHVNEKGEEGAVLAIRLDPGLAPSRFFTQLPPLIGFNDTSQEMGVEIDPRLALNGVNNFEEFWTYQGSLTSPPCKEGIRWFVARSILFTSVDQMKAILYASTYSARAEQEVWLHQINV
jgi:carbonic anhydrase